MQELEAPIRSRNLVPVWSEEILLGNPMTRHYDGAWNLLKIRSLNKPFKILITIRRQTDLCLSAYREYLKFYRHSLGDFIGTGNEPRSFQSVLHWEYLRFDVAAEKYIDAFGPENVLILPQELLRSNPDEFVQRLLSFVDIPTAPPAPIQERNVGLGGTALLSSRLLNALFVRSPLSQKASLSEKASRKTQGLINRISPGKLDKMIENRWREQIERRYKNLYQEGNQKLQSMTDVDLSRFGYL